MTVVTEISPGEFKKYISSSKSVNLMPNGCKMLPRAGKVTFNFSDFNNVTSCKLRFTKQSGNGKVVITVGNKPKSIIVPNNLVQNINLSDDKKVEISRPPDSVGEVLITSIAFDSDGVREPQVSINWKQLIGNCGKYACLRLIKGRLFASAGGFIERGDKVQRIITDPPMSYKYDGKKLVFKNSCEIRHLELSDNSAKPQTKQPFVERQAPQKIEVAQSEAPPPRVAVPTGKPRPAPTHIVDGSLAGIESDVVFDSNTTKFYKMVTVRSKIIKAIKSLGKDYLLLKPGAHFSFPIINLEPTKHYICILYGRSINGNGKMRVGLSSEEHYYGDIREVHFGNGMNSRYVSVNSDRGTKGDSQRLHLMLPAEVCTGEVMINRIVIINNIDIHNSGRKRYDSGPATIRPKINSDGTFDLAITNRSADQHYMSMKKYARFYPQEKDKQADQFFQGSVAVSSSSGMNWFNKMKTMFPGIWLERGKDKKGISISQSGFIKKKDNIWLDATDKILNRDVKVLREAKVVYSPSTRNCQQLSELLMDSGVNVEVLRKPLPWIISQKVPLFNNLEYVVAFDRSDEATSMIVDAWNDKLPKLVLIGARGSFPDFVIPTNEYLKFSQLTYILENAKCVIDLPAVRDYESSFLALCKAIGTPAVTTNWCAMGNTGAVFLVGEKGEGSYLPSKEALKNALKEACQMNLVPLNRSEYNNAEMVRFKKMFQTTS